jgi:hypothetical protein
MSGKKRIVIKTAFIAGIPSVFLFILGGIITGGFHGCVGGAFDVAAQDSKLIPAMIDSEIEKKVAPIKESVKCIPEMRGEVNQMDMRSKLASQMQLRKMSLKERDAAIEDVLRIDTSIKRAEIYKEIYGTNYH